MISPPLRVTARTLGLGASLPGRRVAAGGSERGPWRALCRRAGQGRTAQWLRRSVLRTDCPALLTPGSRGETRYARCASCARTIAASQKYEARFARRPRGCAARRRRHCAVRPCPALRHSARHGPRSPPPAAKAASVVSDAITRPVLASAETLLAKARATVRVARGRRARAQPRSAGAPARARSALRTSDSRRLSERSSRSERSEFRRGAGVPSIAGNPRAAGASTGTPAAGDPHRGTRLCSRKPSVCRASQPTQRTTERAA